MKAQWIAASAALAIAGCSMITPVREDVPRAAIVGDWPRLPDGVKMGQVSAVDVDAQGRVFVLQRGARLWSEPFPTDPIAGATVLVFDRASGRLIDSWGEGLFVMPHGLSVDPQGKVWITDVAREQVYRFSADGTQELAIGTAGVTGADGAHFGRPTDVAFDGERVLIADGYINARIAAFDRAGHFLGQFGRKGEGRGGLNLPHSVAISGEQILVADRENARIARFGIHGAHRGWWRKADGGHPYAVKPLPGGGAVSVEGRDRSGRGGAILRIWGRDGTLRRSLDASPLEGPSKGHDLAVGPDGYAYLADVDAGRVVKIDLGGKAR